MSDFESMMRNMRANQHILPIESPSRFDCHDGYFDEGRKRMERERRSTHLAHLIAERSARDDVLCHAVQEDYTGAVWLNVEHPTITGDERDLIAIAVAYLDSRDLIERNPVEPHLVRLTQRSET